MKSRFVKENYFRTLGRDVPCHIVIKKILVVHTGNIAAILHSILFEIFPNSPFSDNCIWSTDKLDIR